VRSLRSLATYPTGRVLAADDILEFHAARLLVLLFICGRRTHTITGLKKLAKLDFFLRYPSLLREALGAKAQNLVIPDTIESSMIRYHYGPWDRRYYHVLASLEARRLIDVRQSSSRSYSFSLTILGVESATALANAPAFEQLAATAAVINREFGDKSGSYLERFVYSRFYSEVTSRALGEDIRV
jgi:hypothetical protein